MDPVINVMNHLVSVSQQYVQNAISSPVNVNQKLALNVGMHLADATLLKG
jgi:hypothetical protein